jgi:hypothetical protein
MRPFLWLGLAIILVLGVTRLRPAPQISSLPEPDAVRELNARQQAALRRIGEKEVALAALLRGELDLARAAGRFQAADAGDPAALARLRARHPGLRDDEIYHRQVIDFLYAAGRPAAARELARRLEREVGRPRPVDPAGNHPSDASNWRRLGKGQPGKVPPVRRGR